MASVDLGFGDARAPAGTEEWAKRWRVEFYAAVQKLDHYPKSVESFLAIGERFKAWTLLADASGKPFRTFDAFCEAPAPYGLGCPAIRIRAALEQVEGRRAAELLTVSPARPGPGRGIKKAPGAPSLPDDKDKRLRAILRAPEPIRDLYREGLISQKLAAKLGPKNPSPDTAYRIAEVTQVAQQVPRERKAVDAAVRQALGEPDQDPIDRLLHAIRRQGLNAQQLSRLIEGLRRLRKESP